MDDLLSAALSSPQEQRGKQKLAPKSYDHQIKAQISALQQQNASSAWTKPADGKTVLDFLDPTINTIPYVMALAKQFLAAGRDAQRHERLAQIACGCFDLFDPIQLRYIGDSWAILVDYCLRVLETSARPNPTPIVNALLRLDPSAGTFTTVHLRIVRLCLTAGVPSQALPVLDKDIYAFPQDPVKEKSKGQQDSFLCEEQTLSNGFITTRSGHSLHQVEPSAVLEYYLLGAQIYIGYRNYARARLFLEYVLLSPTIGQVASFLQVEAYKKWILVGLLAQGKPYPIPKTIDPTVLKEVRALSRAYDAIAEDVSKRDWRKFQAEMEVGGGVWFEDGNRRLVHEAGQALQRFRVIDLQKSYSALPASEVASQLHIEKAALLPLLQDMIRMRSLNATLTPAGDDHILRFDTALASADIDLDAQTKRIAHLVTYTRDADVRLQLTKEVSEQIRRTKRAEDPADAMDLTYDRSFALPPGNAEDDEDIMAA